MSINKENLRHFNGVKEVKLTKIYKNTINNYLEPIKEICYIVTIKSEFLNLKRVFSDYFGAKKQYKAFLDVEPLYFDINLRLYNLKKELYLNRKNKELVKNKVVEFINQNKEELEIKDYLQYDLFDYLTKTIKLNKDY